MYKSSIVDTQWLRCSFGYILIDKSGHYTIGLVYLLDISQNSIVYPSASGPYSLITFGVLS